jgi:hypothetical protein
MKTLATGLLLALGLTGCVHSVSTDEKRWDKLDGSQVFLVKGYEKIVHANFECPTLATPKGTVIKCRVRDGRLQDEQGNFHNGPDERLPLCSSCVP